MFLSLNKKIIITIVAFFILCFTLFGYTLYSLYNSKLQEDSLLLHLKNQQYNTLLYHYNKLRASNEHNENFIDQPLDNIISLAPQEDLRYQNLKQNLYLALACLSFFGGLIVLMIFLLHSLILRPIMHFTEMNKTIQRGIYNQRLSLPHKLVQDEFNTLETTYNRMLDNIESQIQRINEQRTFLQHIIDGIPDAIRVLDFSGNIVLTNTSYKNNIETSISSCKCYTSLFNRKTPCNKERDNCPLLILQTQKHHKFIQQLTHGQKQYLSVNAARIETAGQPLIIESFRDLSADIKFSHQQKISSLGFLTASIAHEIKNNLGSMRLIIESLIENKTKTTETKKYHQLLYKQLLECIKIPERLLKTAQYSPQENQKINCQEAIEEICSLLDYEATHSGINIKISALPNLSPIIGNETDFKMIILNLSQNAINAMPSGGNLIFDITTTRTALQISIQDTGQGIPEENLPHIFEPFYSSSSSISHTGLGLSIVKSLIGQMGGTIKVTSKLNKGTTFLLNFPYKKKK